jgi:hypothetical protein
MNQFNQAPLRISYNRRHNSKPLLNYFKGNRRVTNNQIKHRPFFDFPTNYKPINGSKNYNNLLHSRKNSFNSQKQIENSFRKSFHFDKSRSNKINHKAKAKARNNYHKHRNSSSRDKSIKG